MAVIYPSQTTWLGADDIGVPGVVNPTTGEELIASGRTSANRPGGIDPYAWADDVDPRYYGHFERTLSDLINNWTWNGADYASYKYDFEVLDNSQTLPNEIPNAVVRVYDSEADLRADTGRTGGTLLGNTAMSVPYMAITVGGTTYLCRDEFRHHSKYKVWAGAWYAGPDNSGGPWHGWNGVLEGNGDWIGAILSGNTISYPLRTAGGRGVMVSGMRSWMDSGIYSHSAWRSSGLHQIDVTLRLNGTAVHGPTAYTIPRHTAGGTWSSINFSGEFECDQVDVKTKQYTYLSEVQFKSRKPLEIDVAGESHVALEKGIQYNDPGLAFSHPVVSSSQVAVTLNGVAHPLSSSTSTLSELNFNNNTGRFEGLPWRVSAPQGNAARRVEVEFRTTNKTTGAGQSPVLLSMGTASTGQAFNVRLNTYSVDQVGVMGYVRDRDVASPVSFTDGNWHTLVVDYDGSTLRIWVDGQVAEAGYDVTYNTLGQNNFLGKSNHFGAEGHYKGDIRNVKLWHGSTGTLTSPSSDPHALVTDVVAESFTPTTSGNHTLKYTVDGVEVAVRTVNVHGLQVQEAGADYLLLRNTASSAEQLSDYSLGNLSLPAASVAAGQYVAAVKAGVDARNGRTKFEADLKLAARNADGTLQGPGGTSVSIVEVPDLAVSNGAILQPSNHAVSVGRWLAGTQTLFGSVLARSGSVEVAPGGNGTQTGLSVYNVPANPSSVMATMSGRPFPTFAADGDLDQYDGYDPTAHWDYLNASGFSGASEQNPKAITYTLTQEVLLTGLAHTQVAASEARRASLRSFFVNTIDAAGTVTRHPATGTFDADPALTLTWETFDFVAAAATKTLQICLTEPPENNYNDSNLLYLYEILLKVGVTDGLPKDTTPPTLARHSTGATVRFMLDSAEDRYQDAGVTATDAGGPDPPTVTATIDGQTVAVTQSSGGVFTVPKQALSEMADHEIVYTATDHAGNSSTVSRTVQVRNGTAPALVIAAPQFSTVGDIVGLRFQDDRLGRLSVQPSSATMDVRQSDGIGSVVDGDEATSDALTRPGTTYDHLPSTGRFMLTIANGSGSAATGAVLVGKAPPSPLKVSQASTHDGSGGGVQTHTFDNDMSGNFSIRVSVYVASPTSAYHKPVLSWYKASGNTNQTTAFNLQIQGWSGNVNFFMGNGTTTEGYHDAGYGIEMSGGVLPAATWTDIRIDMINDTVTLYVDGTQKATAAFSGGTRQLYPGEPLTIGRFNNGTLQHFVGSISDVSVSTDPMWTRGSGAFAGFEYLANNTPMTWEQHEVAAQALSAHIASVHSAAENDFLRDTMYPSGGHFWIGYKQLNAADRISSFEWSDGTTGPYTPTWTGNFQSYDSFISEESNSNINDATVPLPIVAPQGAAPRRFKIEFRTTSTATMFLLSTGTAESTKTFGVRLNAFATNNVGVMGYWPIDRDVPSPVTLADGEWHTVTVDYDGAKLRIWVDGLVAESGWSVTYSTSGQNNFVGISNHEGGPNAFDGDIRYISFWNYSSGSLADPSYVNWNAGEPDNGLAHPYAHFYGTYKWNDGTPGTVYGAVYKRPVHGHKLLFADSSGNPLALDEIVSGDVAGSNLWDNPSQTASVDSDWHIEGWRYDSRQKLEVRFATPLSGDLRIYWTKDNTAGGDSTESISMPLNEIRLVRTDGHPVEFREQILPLSVTIDARERSDIGNVINPYADAGSYLTMSSTTSAHFPIGRDRFTLTLGVPPNEDIRSVVLEGDPSNYQASQGWKLMFTDGSGVPLPLKGIASGDIERFETWSESWKRVPSAVQNDWHVQGWRFDRDPRLEVVFAEPLTGAETQIRWTKESQDTDVNIHMFLRSISFVRHTLGSFVLPTSVAQDVRERDDVSNLIDGDLTTSSYITQSGTTYSSHMPSSGYFTLTLGSPGTVNGVTLFGNPSDYQATQGRRLRFADAAGNVLALSSVIGSVTASKLSAETPSRLTFESVSDSETVLIPFVEGFQAVVRYAFFAPAASNVSSTLQAEIDKGEDVSFKAQDGLFGDPAPNIVKVFSGVCDYVPADPENVPAETPSRLTFESVSDSETVLIPFVEGFQAVVRYAFFAPAASNVSSTLQAEIDKGEDVSFKAQDGLFGDPAPNFVKVFSGVCDYTTWHVEGWRYDAEPNLEVRFAEPLEGDLRIQWNKESENDDLNVHMNIVAVRFLVTAVPTDKIRLQDVAVRGRFGPLSLETQLDAADVVTLHNGLTFTNTLPDGASRVLALGQGNLWTDGFDITLRDDNQVYGTDKPNQHTVARVSKVDGQAVPLSTSKAWRVVNDVHLHSRPAYSVTLYDEFGDPIDPSAKTAFHSSHYAAGVAHGWDGDDDTHWEPVDATEYARRTVWLALGSADPFHVSRFRVNGSQNVHSCLPEVASARSTGLVPISDAKNVVFHEGWMASGIYEYLANPNRLSWSEHQERARALGGDLATIASTDEVETITSLGLRTTDPVHGNTYIAGRKDASTWSTGMPMDYKRWNADEPATGQTCVDMEADERGVHRYLEINMVYGHQNNPKDPLRLTKKPSTSDRSWPYWVTLEGTFTITHTIQAGAAGHFANIPVTLVGGNYRNSDTHYKIWNSSASGNGDWNSGSWRNGENLPCYTGPLVASSGYTNLGEDTETAGSFSPAWSYHVWRGFYIHANGWFLAGNEMKPGTYRMWPVDLEVNHSTDFSTWTEDTRRFETLNHATTRFYGGDSFWNATSGSDPKAALYKRLRANPGWVEWQGHEYLMVTNTMTFEQHEWQANRMGAHLASIHSQAENEFVTGISSDRVWLGGRRKADGGWEWTDGTPFNFTSWYTGEPSNDASEDYVVMWDVTDPQGSWNDVGNSPAYPAVYKRPVAQWTAWNGNEYLFARQNMSWEDHESAASVVYGAHLVSVLSSEEMDFVTNLAGDAQVWLGGSGGSGSWTWSDGSAFVYTNWDSGEPGEGHHTLATPKWQDRTGVTSFAVYKRRGPQVAPASEQWVESTLQSEQLVTSVSVKQASESLNIPVVRATGSSAYYFHSAYQAAKAFDKDFATQWATLGESTGSHITGYFGSYRKVNRMMYQNRAGQERNAGLRLTFSDGSTQNVTLANDATQQFFDLTAVTTSFVRIDVVSHHTHGNNGAVEIQFFSDPVGLKDVHLLFSTGEERNLTLEPGQEKLVLEPVRTSSCRLSVLSTHGSGLVGVGSMDLCFIPAAEGVNVHATDLGNKVVLQKLVSGDPPSGHHPDVWGGGWTLVRHMPQGSTNWYPVNDNAALTATFGTFEDDPTSSNAFGRAVDSSSYTHVLFATAAPSNSVPLKWMVMTKEEMTRTGAAIDFEVVASHTSAQPYTAQMYNRDGGANPEDPWFSTDDHGWSQNILYGENGTTFNTGNLSAHGVNVFVVDVANQPASAAVWQDVVRVPLSEENTVASAHALDFHSDLLGTHTVTVTSKDAAHNFVAQDFEVVFGPAPTMDLDEDSGIMRHAESPAGRPLAVAAMALGRDLSAVAMPVVETIGTLLSRSLSDVATAVGSTEAALRAMSARDRFEAFFRASHSLGGGEAAYNSADAYAVWANVLSVNPSGGAAAGQAVGAANPEAETASGVGVKVQDAGTYVVRVAEDAAEVGVTLENVTHAPVMATRVEKYDGGQLSASATPALRFSTAQPSNANRSYVVWRKMADGRWVQQRTQAGTDSEGNVVLDA